jgi:hypothetical protein
LENPDGARRGSEEAGDLSKAEGSTMKVQIIAAMICSYSAFAQTAAAVTIRVVNSVTKTAIAGANVTIDGTTGAQHRQLAGRTDSSGVFTGNAEVPGSHLLTARHNGYRMIGTGIMGKIIEIQAGQANEITLEMLPQAVIAGRILDQYGDPVRHAIVSTQAKMGGPGRGVYTSLFAATSDDRGEYRIADVEPGGYYLVIEYSSSDERYYNSPLRYKWPEYGGLALFPDAADIEHAQQVETRAGETTRLPDVRLTIQRAVTISGRIKPAQADRAFVSVQRAGPNLSRHQSGNMSREFAPDGTFRVEVLPGTYTVRASDRSGKISPTLTIDARDKNVADLELTLGQGYEISGRLIVDGPERLDFSKVILNFFTEPVKIEATGAFHTTSVNSEAGCGIQGLPEDWYLKDCRVAGHHIAGRHFHLEPGQTEVVLTLSAKGARVEIATEGDSGGNGTLHAAMLALLPESGIVDVDSMFASERDDPAGKFVLHGVPPGEYRVFALDVSNWALLLDPGTLLEKYRKLASLVTVAEGEHKTIAVSPTKIPVE